MNYKNYVLLVFLIIISHFFVSAQTSTTPDELETKLIQPYTDYFTEARQAIHVHFNKAAYMAGENIWFKVYTTDKRSGKPFIVPQNMYVELMDEEGKAVEQQILYASGGSAMGNVFLPDTLESGQYTFRAYSNWMRNFGTEGFYVKEIEVAGLNSAKMEAELQTTAGFDIQLLPEGGSLVAGIINNIGVKIVAPDGKGAQLKGVLKNGQGQELAAIATNAMGIGSFSTQFEIGGEYTAEFTLPDGNVQKVELPEVKEYGLACNVQWFYPKHIAIYIQTNQQTLPKIAGKKFYVFIHNRGNIASAFYFTLTGKTVGRMNVPKKDLLNGINHVTVFDENMQPVTDRMIFIRKPESYAQLSISDLNFQKDTLSGKVQVVDTAGLGLMADMSFSFLPGETKVGNFKENIYTSLLMRSELSGFIENPAWYFEKNDYEHQKALNDLLLTQGWRKYAWNDILNGQAPKIIFPLEQGFTIKGKVQNSLSRKPMEESRVSLFSIKNSLLLAADVDAEGQFSFPKLYLSDSSKVVISASSQKGKKGFRELLAEVNKPLFEKTMLKDNFPVEKKYLAQSGLKSIAALPGMEMLDAVTVTGKEKEENPFENDVYASMNDRVVIITKENYHLYNSVIDLLRKAFFVQVQQMGGEVSVNLGRGNRGAPVIIVDGIPMEDASMLSILTIADIEAVAVNKGSNAMLGSRGGNGSISIKTRIQGVDWGRPKDLAVKRMDINGFNNPVAYYAPKYQVGSDNPLYRQNAAVYWHPAIISDSTGTASFRFYVPKEIGSLKIRAEGLSIRGKLVFYDRLLELPVRD